AGCPQNVDAPTGGGNATCAARLPPPTEERGARQSGDVAKTASNPPSPPARESVFERAEKALAAIPKSRSSTPPAQPSAPAPTAAVVPLPPTPPSPPSAQDTASVSPVTAPPATSTAAVAPMTPPPMDPPREIASPHAAADAPAARDRPPRIDRSAPPAAPGGSALPQSAPRLPERPGQSRRHSVGGRGRHAAAPGNGRCTQAGAASAAAREKHRGKYPRRAALGAARAPALSPRLPVESRIRPENQSRPGMTRPPTKP